MELLGSPRLLFCDEPTSGLDSFQAEKVHLPCNPGGACEFCAYLITFSVFVALAMPNSICVQPDVRTLV